MLMANSFYSQPQCDEWAGSMSWEPFDKPNETALTSLVAKVSSLW